jgi:hypothetical protein
MMILLAPFLFLLITSALGKYPFSGRMLLFLIPLLLLLLAEGVERVGMVLNKISSPLAWFVAFSFVVYFLSGPITVAYKNVISPPMGEDIKPVMLYISKNYRRTDLFYLYYRAAPAFEFYAPSYRLGSVKYIVGITSIQDSTKYLDDIDKLKGRYRIWFVFSHNCESNFINQQDFILEHLNKIGLIMYELKSSCVSLYLYDLR